jgi:hypothetical protein
MQGGQFSQDSLSVFGQFQCDAPLVAAVAAPDDISGSGEPVDQPDRAVVADGKPLGEIADRRHAALMALDGQKRLMLLRRETDFRCPFLAEYKK